MQRARRIQRQRLSAAPERQKRPRYWELVYTDSGGARLCRCSGASPGEADGYDFLSKGYAPMTGKPAPWFPRCSSRVAKVWMERFASRLSTSRSERLLPSMRVEDPTLSMVATRRRAVSRSGASVPNAFHAPLNSSIWAMSRSISGVMFRVSTVTIPTNSPKNIHFVKPIIHPISSEAGRGCGKPCFWLLRSMLLRIRFIHRRTDKFIKRKFADRIVADNLNAPSGWLIALEHIGADGCCCAFPSLQGGKGYIHNGQGFTIYGYGVYDIFMLLGTLSAS